MSSWFSFGRSLSNTFYSTNRTADATAPPAAVEPTTSAEDVKPPIARPTAGVTSSSSDADESSAKIVDDDRSSIRAPVTDDDDLLEETEEGAMMDADDESNDSFGSARERAESVSSLASSPPDESSLLSATEMPRAKLTTDMEDFSVPPAVVDDAPTGAGEVVARSSAQEGSTDAVVAALSDPTDEMAAQVASVVSRIPAEALRQVISQASEQLDMEDVEEGDEEEEDEDWEEDEDENPLNELVRGIEEASQRASRVSPEAAAAAATAAEPSTSESSQPRGLSNGSMDLLPQRRAAGTAPPSDAATAAASAVDGIVRQAAAAVARQGGEGIMQSTMAAAAAAGSGEAGAVSAPVDSKAEKVNSVRVKLLRLASRLGQSPSNGVVAQVLYRLDLAEKFHDGGISSRARAGAAMSAVSGPNRLERARVRSQELEATEGTDSNLDFDITCLLLGKTGVGKTATVKSLLGLTEVEERGPPEEATRKVRQVVGMVHGVRMKIIDMPGLQASASEVHRNHSILRSARKALGRSGADIVLYFDRLDMLPRDQGDVEMLRCVTDVFGPTVWMNTIVVMTHAGTAPPEDTSGRAMSYEMYVAQRSHAVLQAVRQAAGDARLLNPVALVENNPSCRTNRAGERVLPNGQVWRPQLLLLCFASKCLSEANSVLEIGSAGAMGRAGGFQSQMLGRTRMPPLPYLLSSLLGARQPLRLPEEQALGDGDDEDDDDDEDEDGEDVDFDSLPPFRRLTRAELTQLEPRQRKEYFEEVAVRERLFQKKQWREELRRRREMRRRLEIGEGEGLEGSSGGGGSGGAGEAEAAAEEDAPSTVPVQLPEIDLPPSFDSDLPTHRYRYIETASQWLVRPMLEQNGWDHDTGYDGFQVEKTAVLANKVPTSFSGQINKDKKDSSLALEAAASYRHGPLSQAQCPITTAGLDLQSVGSGLSATLRSETRIPAPLPYLPRNRATVGASISRYQGTNGVAAGLKVEDRLALSKTCHAHGAAGFVKYGRYMARGANFEVQLRAKDHPIDKTSAALGTTLMHWQGDLVVGVNAQAQGTAAQTNFVVRANCNNRAAGTISIRASSSEQLYMAAVGLIPLLRYLLKGGFLFGKGEELEMEEEIDGEAE